MAVKFFNTLTREKEEFKPMKKGKAAMYTCGPTVYNFAHIGNYRAYTFEDILRRYLKYRGFQVTQVMNITDVDDKIINAVRGKGISASDYAVQFTEAFHRDLETLNVEKAEFYPKATEHIPEMVNIIKVLLDKGIAYRGEDGSIYFSIAKFPEYGKLAHFEPGELKAGARVKHDEYDKENVSDFALWKAWDENDGDVFWETELGKGRPGWHIECTAMSAKYLGNHFDIHTGGIDNMFPHHENEIAQAEASTGEKFVNYWLHCDHLLVDGSKMAKSKGNFYTLRDIVEKGYNPMAMRYFYVTSDYRKKLDFSLENLESSSKALTKIYEFLRRVKEMGTGESSGKVEELIATAKKDFEDAMDDDLNAPMAMGYIFTFISEINKVIDEGKLSATDSNLIIDFMLDIDRVFGLKMDEALVEKELAGEIKALIEERYQARKDKNFARSDEIRDLLKAKGIILMDTPQGTRWKVQV
ncbi:MAG: cysteine--tRNA ligase [Firmicutes bacterium]|nr:cysteine--tRNA ligase [Bacillota bacterium]